MSKNTNISELINYLCYDGSGNIVFTTVSAAATNTDKFLVSDAGTLKFRTAAQLLSDIGAQASGSYQAALSGTGFVKISGSTISYDNSTYATETYVGTAISNLVASSPATLDTLNELALALGSDPNFATTVATSIGTKQAQLNGTGFVKVTGTTISYDNSTYLTTTTAGTTYVPYTGATASVDLGAFLLTASGVDSVGYTARGSGTLSGYLILKQGTTYLGNVVGYNSINANARKYVFISDVDGTNYKSAIFELSSLTNNTDRTYTLPDASGILALTSNLSSYLPLAGGILTGALSGTSATFSSSVTANSSTTGTQVMANFAAANYSSPSSRTYIQIGTQYGDGSSRIGSINTTGNQSALVLQSHSATSGVWNDAIYIDGGGEVLIGTTTNAGYKLDVNGTGRFSGALTSGSHITSTNGYIYGAYNAGDVILWGGIAPYANIYGALSWDVDKAIIKGRAGYGLGMYVDNNSSKGITLATTGAATFSSSVTANQIFSITTAAGYAAILTNTNGASDSNGLLVKASSVGTEYVVRFANQTDTSTFFTIKGTGNVLIGTTADNGGKLQVTTTDQSVGFRLAAANSQIVIYPYYYTYGGPIVQVLNAAQTATVPLRIEASATTFTGTLAATSATFTTTNTTPLIIQTTGGNCGIQILTSSTTHSWLVAAQYSTANTFEITPSTTVGGQTYSTPALKILNSGAATFSSSLGIGGAFSFNNGSITSSGELSFNSAALNIYTYGRVGLANAGRIIFNNGTGANLWFGETSSNVYGFTPNAYNSPSVVSMNMSSGDVTINNDFYVNKGIHTAKYTRVNGLYEYVRHGDYSSSNQSIQVFRQFHDVVNWGTGGQLIEITCHGYATSEYDHAIYFVRYGYGSNSIAIDTRLAPITNRITAPYWGSAINISGNDYYRDLMFDTQSYRTYKIVIKTIAPLTPSATPGTGYGNYVWVFGY